ncbi:MAG TPA: iron-containing alcohol dehydrogenase [Pseudogracilibacillus sp.]|nr:iron-containing alcohol dehydrogenase [Pseudogracilibacillus sp.]
MKMATFKVPSKILYGKNAVKELKNILPTMGKKALIITDEVMVKIGTIGEILKILEDGSVAYDVYSGINTEPNSNHVKEALKVCEYSKSDFIISLGGGSCIDLAKAISVLAYRDNHTGIKPNDNHLEDKLKHIAIPTTAGTGSEVTDVTVITDLETDQKVMMKNTYYTPTVALVDPQFTYSCPKQIIANTGVDALCHAIESLMSIKTNSFSEKFAWSSIELILNNLEKAYTEENNKPYMDKMALASLEAGIAFSNASVCLVHGMSRPLGAVFNVPHGVSNAMLLNTVLEFSKENIIGILEIIGKISMNNHLIESNLSNRMTRSDLGLYQIKKLLEKLEIPSISEWGIDKVEFKKALDKMTNDALLSGSPQNNPIVPTAEQIKELYLQSF